MKEVMLHTLWKLKMLPHGMVFTTHGDPLSILSYGSHNQNSGPDFSQAKISLDGTLWAGHIEIHVFSSDWNLHGHSNDPAYKNVILHVVWEEDIQIIGPTGRPIPCLELKGIIPTQYLENYESLLKNDLWIPCQNLINSTSPLTLKGWLDRLTIERLEIKTSNIQARLSAYENDWEEVFYQFLLVALGLKVNTSSFDEIARTLPLKLLMKYSNNTLQIEALLMGQAGLLENIARDNYSDKLSREYAFLSKKHGLKPIKEKCKFMRLRPASFPTLRLSQFANVLSREKNLLSKCLEAKRINELRSIFNVSSDGYWLTHYVFGKESKARKKSLGRKNIDLLIINTIVPFCFLYGRKMARPEISTRALALLEELKPERNVIIEKWENFGIQATNAGESQSLLQLKKEYCDKKRCLDCSIGIEIIKSN